VIHAPRSTEDAFRTGSLPLQSSVGKEAGW
jgi:hypothetical protein